MALADLTSLISDPRDRIAAPRMSALQILVIGITIALNAIDGFDVLSISYASPGIASEWGIDRAALGIVLSIEVVGMAIGSVGIGGVADTIGRRPTILGCLVVMATGMVMTTTVHGVIPLAVWRIVTGLGIGGMLASINAVAAEFSTPRRRHLSVSLMSIGYPLGAVLGGIVAGRLLQNYSWRSVFFFGAAVSASFIPIVLAAVPESKHWLATDRRRTSIADIFAPGMRRGTVIVTVAYFCHITTFYFVVKWIPKIVADLGFPASSAATVLVWTNVGGAIGGAVLGLLTQRLRVKALTIAVLAASTVLVTALGRSPADLHTLSMICAGAGFSINAGIVGLFAIIAQAFPTHVRAFGTGFTVGIGRGGSMLAPVIAGIMFTAGYSLPVVAVTLGVGSLLGAIALALLSVDDPLSTPAGCAQPFFRNSPGRR